MKKERSDFQKEINKLFRSIQRNINTMLDKIDSSINSINETVEIIQQSSKVSSRISRISIGLTVIMVLLTIGIVAFGIYQFNITKIYQDWTIKEMSRKPELYLEAREIEIVDSINKEAIFRCDLVNSGDRIAKYIQIRHSLSRYFDSTRSISVYSPLKDIVFYRDESNARDSILDRGSYNTEKIKILDSTNSVSGYSAEKKGTVYFAETDKNAVSMKVYKNQEVIYFDQKEGQDYSLKLPYIWRLSNMSPKIDAYYIPYFIDSDEGIFEDTIRIENPFYKKEEESSKDSIISINAYKQGQTFFEKCQTLSFLSL